MPVKERQRTKVQDKKESCVCAARLGSAIAAASRCVRSDLSDANPVQGARVALILCRGGNCRCVCVCCVVPAVVTCGDVAAGTRACASVVDSERAQGLSQRDA